MGFLERVGQIVGMLPDVVQRCSDSPAERLLCKHIFFRDVIGLQIIQQFFRGGGDALNALHIRVSHAAIGTPSRRIVR